MPERTFATLDHIIPTTAQQRPFADAVAEEMAVHMTATQRVGWPFRPGQRAQGIVHVIGPELGLTQPGMTIACGDSHTATHGAVGAIAFGIGTSQVRDVLATQCLAMAKPKLRQVRVDGALGQGRLRQGRHPGDHPHSSGVKGASATPTSTRATVMDRMTMEERLTLCNMSHRGRRPLRLRQPGRRPRSTTCAGRPYAPPGEAFDRAVDVVEGHRDRAAAPPSTTSSASTATRSSRW